MGVYSTSIGMDMSWKREIPDNDWSCVGVQKVVYQFEDGTDSNAETLGTFSHSKSIWNEDGKMMEGPVTYKGSIPEKPVRKSIIIYTESCSNSAGDLTLSVQWNCNFPEALEPGSSRAAGCVKPSLGVVAKGNSPEEKRKKEELLKRMPLAQSLMARKRFLLDWKFEKPIYDGEVGCEGKTGGPRTLVHINQSVESSKIDESHPFVYWVMVEGKKFEFATENGVLERDIEVCSQPPIRVTVGLQRAGTLYNDRFSPRFPSAVLDHKFPATVMGLKEERMLESFSHYTPSVEVELVDPKEDPLLRAATSRASAALKNQALRTDQSEVDSRREKNLQGSTLGGPDSGIRGGAAN